MNAPMMQKPMGPPGPGMPPPSMGATVPAPGGPGMAPQPPMPGGTPPGGGYPSGTDIMAAEAPQGNVENPVLAGFRTIIQLIGALKEKGDPRGDAALNAFKAFMDTLSGGDLPMQPPLPEQPGIGAPQPGGMAPPMGPPPMGGPGMGPPPMGPPPDVPAMGGAPPEPEMIGNPFEAPAPTQGPKARPMAPRAPMKAGVKQPTILT